MLCAAVVCAASWEVRAILRKDLNQAEYEEFHGLSRVDTGRLLKCPMTQNNVTEGAFDTNGDGKDDFWTVTIRGGTDFECEYHAFDTNLDGIPDTMAVRLSSHKMGYATFDDDGDGIPDRVSVTLGNHSDPSSWYDYEDLDLDGRIDCMSKVHESSGDAENTTESYVLLDNAWRRDDGFASRSAKELRKAWITEGQRKVAVVFANGRWEVQTETAI